MAFPVITIRKRKQTDVVDTILFKGTITFSKVRGWNLSSNQEIPQGEDKTFARKAEGWGWQSLRPCLRSGCGVGNPRLCIKKLCCEIQGLSPFPFEVHFVLFWNAVSLG